MNRSGTGPISLRISVTDRCGYRCLYCMPAEGVAARDRRDVLRFEEIVRFVRLARDRFGLTKVHLTGGEPLARKSVEQLVGALAALGLPDLALTTNGARLADRAEALKQAGLRRVNVSLDTLDPRRFEQLTRGGRLRDVLDGIDAAEAAGLTPIKLNAAVLRGVNDDEIADLARFGMRRGLPVRFLELMPIGPAAERFDEWFVPAGRIQAKLSQAFELCPVARPSGASSVGFQARSPDGLTGQIGLICSMTAPFCGDCRRLRLAATGELIGCLARGNGADVRAMLRDPADGAEERLVRTIEASLTTKRTDSKFPTTRLMGAVGG